MQVFIPESAPFTNEQRAWLNGFVAGLLGMERALETSHPGVGRDPVPIAEDDLPWHDPTLALDERMKLAADRAIPLRLMAAMGQLDCGQCGYECRTYAAAIAGGTETDLGKCVPGGRETAKKVKEIAATLSIIPLPRQRQKLPIERGYNRDAPVAARLVSSASLTARAAEKETRHIVIDLAGSDLAYEPGDSLGIWPQNNPDEVELLIAILKAKGSEAVTLADGAIVTARDALTRECDLRAPTDTLYKLLAAEAKDDADRSRLAKLAHDDAQAETFGVHDVLDAVLEFPSARPRIAEFVAALGRLQPRMYSLASSLRRHPAEA